MNEFERQKTIYQEQQQSFRSLNQQMWQIPIIAMTLTGGLWFAVSSLQSDSFQRMLLLLLAGAGNSGLVLVLWRVRSLMKRLLEKMRQFEGEMAISSEGNKWWDKPGSVQRIFSFLLIFGAIISILLAFAPLLGSAILFLCSV